MSYTNTLSERTCRYDIDDTDFRWLMSVNNDREDYGLEPLEESFVEQVMEELEDQCYVNFQEAIKSEEGLGVEYDEDAICDVCRSPESMDLNEMVFCDSCNICVHQICYGITKIPKGSWICRTCALGIRPPCVLCPNRGGAMKTTRCGQNWAHVGCAVWIPEVSFLNFVKMEPIIKVSQIPASRWNLVCSLCKEKTGACITCAEKGCKTAFHVTCAFNVGLQMRTTVKSTYNDDDDFKAYCHKHTQKISPSLSESEDDASLNTSSNSKESLTSGERANLRKHKIQEKEAVFYNYVNINDVVEMFECDRSDIETIFNYWKLKRKANFNRPFLRPKVDTESSCTGENSPLALLKKMVHHRQDLERARNLCYMVEKREKQTKRWIETKENIFFKQLEILEKNGKTLSPEEREAVINANDGDIAHDKKYAGENGPSPNMVSVLTNLVGEDAVKTKLNGIAKSPTKKLDCSKGERTPNPYAKHYLNGLMKRSQRWYPVAGSKPKKSRCESESQKDRKSNQNFSLLSSSSDHMLSSDGHELSEPKTDSHFESDSCVSQPEEVFKSDVESYVDFDNPEPASFSNAKENIFSSVDLKEGLNGAVNGSSSKEYSREVLNTLDLYVYPPIEMQADDTSLLSNVENVLPVAYEATSSNCVAVEVKPDVEATKTDSCESSGGDKKRVENTMEKSQHKLKSKTKSLSKKKEFHSKNSVGDKSDLKKNSKIFNSKTKNDGKERDISTNGKSSEVSSRTSKEHCKNENHSKNSKSAMKSILGSAKVSKPKKNNVKSSELLNLPQKSYSTEDKPSSSDIISSDLDLKSIVDNSCKVSLERLDLEQSIIQLPLPMGVLHPEDVNINNNASLNKSNAIKTDDKSVAKDSTPSDILNVIDKRDKSSVSSTNSSCESKSDAKFRPLPTKNSVTRTQSPVHMKVVENGAGKLNKCNPKHSSSEKPSSSLKAKAPNTAAAPSGVNKHSSSSPSTTKCQEKAATPVSEENSVDSLATKEKPAQVPPVMPVNNLRNYRIPKKTTRDNSLDLKRGSSPLSPLPDIASSNLGSGYQTKVPKSTWRTLEPKNTTSCKSRTTMNGDCQQPSERLVLKLTKDPDLQRWKTDPNNYNRGGGMPPVWHGDFMPGHIPPLLPPPMPPFVPNRWPPRMRDQGAYGLHPNFNRPGHYT